MLQSQTRHGVYSSAELTFYLSKPMTADDHLSSSSSASSPLRSHRDGHDSISYSPRSKQQRQQRFVESIITGERDEFHRLLPVIDWEETIDSWTPLIWAIQRDQQWAIEEFFKITDIIDFRKHIFRGRTVLHFAAEKGDAHLFRLIVSRNRKQSVSTLDLNSVDREHCSALFCAAKVGDADIVNVLLSNGANPNLTNSDGMDFDVIFFICYFHSDFISL